MTTLNDFIKAAQEQDFLFLDSFSGFVLKHKAGDGLNCCFLKKKSEAM